MSTDTETTALENPGGFFFPPLASLITAGARLMLALLERCVKDAGGTYAFCDTDSIAIVATEGGGRVRPIGTNDETRRMMAGMCTLSWRQVRRIVRRFADLNPYDRTVVPGSILEIKEVNFDAAKRQREVYAYVISAKRYTFFVRTRNGVDVVEPSEISLGQYLNPLPGVRRRETSKTPKWVGEVWTNLVRRALGMHTRPPSYAHLPVVSRINVSSPHVLRAFANADAKRPIGKRIRPLNFLTSAQVAPLGHPVGADVGRFHLASRYESDPRKALALPWIDIHTGKPYRVTTDVPPPPNAAALKTHGLALAAHAVHPETKSAGPDGSRCCAFSKV